MEVERFMEYIKVTNENIDKEHICCAISNNNDILNDIPFECQEFVLKHDKYLMGKGSMRTIKSAKSGL